MSQFKFKIYDTHEVQSFGEEGLSCKAFDWWHKFWLLIDVSEITITSFREYILFDAENNPTKCTKVFLSDGTFVFAVDKFAQFEQSYLDIYIPLFRVLPSDSLLPYPKI
jgi:hypothetical protein